MPRARPRIRPQVRSTVGAPTLSVPQNTTPHAVQASESTERLRSPLVISRRSFGRRAISAAGIGVRSRMSSTASKGARRAASASGSVSVSRNTVGVRCGSRPQGPRPSATPWWSSRIASFWTCGTVSLPRVRREARAGRRE